MSPPLDNPTVVGIGEALFDVFPSGPRLGGAPLNVAVHAHRLLKPHGGSGQVVSRIADDDLGRRLLHRLAELSIDDEFIQRDAPSPTGRVEIEQHDDGGHDFHIAAQSAWDHLAFTTGLADLAARCAAVAYGCLAQRHDLSARTITSFLAAAPQAIKLFDVNLRSSDGKSFYDAPTLLAGCDSATLVKLNDEELQTVCDLTETADAEALVKRFDLQALIFTRGAKGTAALTPDGWVEGTPSQYDREADADTVGAGDACSAGLLASLVRHNDLREALDLANRMGAFVAAKPGATPDLPDDLLGQLG